MSKPMNVVQAVKHIQPKLPGLDAYSLLAELRRTDRPTRYTPIPFIRKRRKVYYRAEDLAALVKNVIEVRRPPEEPPTAAPAKPAAPVVTVTTGKSGAVLCKLNDSVYVRLDAEGARKLAKDLAMAIRKAS